MKILLSLLLTIVKVYSQENTNDVETLLVKKTLLIKIEGSKFNINEITKKVNHFLTIDDLSKANESIYSSEFNEVISIEGSTTNSSVNGKKKKYFLKDITESDEIQNGIFYSGSKLKNISFSNIEKNSVTKLKYIKKIKDPHFLPSVIFTGNVPIKEYRFNIIFPENVDLGFKLINGENSNITFKKEKVDKNNVYRWTLSNLPKTNRNYDFSPLYYIPHLIPYIKSYTYKNKEYKLLGDISDLYNWYQSFTKNINTTNQDKIKKKTEQLIKGIKDEDSIIKKIYYNVQNSINYIAFEDGMNGFVPRDAASIYDNKYGDCKDMANLLSEMLNYAGVEAHLTWIGTRRKPYSYYEVATPIVDNHMITAIINRDKDTLFLDATAKYLTYPSPSPFTQGKEALIGFSNKEFKIVKVPETKASKNKIEIENLFTINNNELKGMHKVKILGYEKLHALHNLKNREKNSEDFIYNKFKIGKRKSKFLNLKTQNKELIKDTLKLEFESNTRNIVSKIRDDIYIKTVFDNFLSSDLVKNDEVNFDKKIEYKSTREIHSEIRIPPNYKLKFLPENTTLNRQNFSFLKEFKREEGSVHIYKKIIINTLKIKVDEIPDWNKFIKKIIKANKETIVLTKEN